jgi:hypothetical protein
MHRLGRSTLHTCHRCTQAGRVRTVSSSSVSFGEKDCVTEISSLGPTTVAVVLNPTAVGGPQSDSQIKVDCLAATHAELNAFEVQPLHRSRNQAMRNCGVNPCCDGPTVHRSSSATGSGLRIRHVSNVEFLG